MNRIDFPIRQVDPNRYRNPWHPDDPSVFSQTFRKWKLDFPWQDVPEETLTLLERSRLTMKCPHCNNQEPAGPWCSQCGRMVTHENWFQGTSTEPGTGKRRRGRPSRADIAYATRTCTCE
jgi:endogenous inhibitor of DNA gyrase (YacG/DUF329 family)